MSIVIGGVEIPRGTKQFVKLNVGTIASGATVELPVHVSNGLEKGPKLLLMGVLHGNEWPPVEYIREVMMDTEPNDLAGALIAVPVANPLAYQSETRLMLVGGDEKGREGDLNRLFPGNPKGSLSAKIAYALTEEVIKKADYVIDFHSVPLSRSAYCGTEVGKKPGGEVDKKALELAKIYGLENILETDLPRGSCLGYCSELGIPGFDVECGSTYFGVGPFSPDCFVRRNVTGIRNIMVSLGMMRGKIVEPKKQVLVNVTHRTLMRAAHGGHFCPEIGIDRLGDSVKEGELLGRTISPYSFEELECFKAPYNGVCYVIRGPGPVHIGDMLYCIADLGKVTWIKRPGSIEC